jgi:hypothetical protein
MLKPHPFINKFVLAAKEVDGLLFKKKKEVDGLSYRYTHRHVGSPLVNTYTHIFLKIIHISL